MKKMPARLYLQIIIHCVPYVRRTLRHCLLFIPTTCYCTILLPCKMTILLRIATVRKILLSCCILGIYIEVQYMCHCLLPTPPACCTSHWRRVTIHPPALSIRIQSRSSSVGRKAPRDRPGSRLSHRCFRTFLIGNWKSRYIPRCSLSL